MENDNTQGVQQKISDESGSNISRGSLGTLETFQKYKIINAHTLQLKQIFINLKYIYEKVYKKNN